MEHGGRAEHPPNDSVGQLDATQLPSSPTTGSRVPKLIRNTRAGSDWSVRSHAVRATTVACCGDDTGGRAVN